jgi:hypothetical protein
MVQAQESADSAGGETSRGRWHILLIAVSFAGSFAVACSLLLAIGHYGLNSPRSLWPFDGAAVGPMAKDGIETGLKPFLVSRGGTYLKAAVGDSANPTTGYDYSLFVWFKLRKAPAVGEALGLVGKFDPQQPGRPGYAVSLEGAPDGIRPRVYVSAGETPGRWYSFSSYPINRRDWYLLTISIVDDAFISASLGRALSKDPPVLLGGHRISGPLPTSQADLVIGAFGASRFRGQIGPFGILSGSGIAKRLTPYLTAMQGAPQALPAGLPKAEIRVWGSPFEDLGPQRIGIVAVQGEAPGTEGSVVKPSKKDAPKRLVKRGVTVKKAPKQIEKKKAR